MMQVQMPKFAKISSYFICIYEKIAGGRGSALDPIVTAVCVYILSSLSYDRVLEKCFWGPGKSWKSPGNFGNQESGNPSLASHLGSV